MRRQAIHARHSGWSRSLPRPLIIGPADDPVLTLTTLGDVRELISHVPADRRKLDTWRKLAADLDDAARSGDVDGLAVSLRLVLFLERVEVNEA